MSINLVLLLITAFVVAILLAGLQYFSVKNTKRKKNWVVLLGLRTLTYFAVFLLLINPQFNQKSYTIEKPNLAVVVDNSSSISAFKKTETAEKIFQQIRSNKDLKEKFSLQSFQFDANFKQYDDSLSFRGSQTNLHALFKNLNALYGKENAPAIIISDGNPTYGSDFIFEAKKYKSTIYPIVLGDTTSYQDLQIKRINANKFAFLDNKFPVEVFINYSGEKSVNSNFRIKLGQTTVFQQKLNLGPNKRAEVIQTHLPAKSVGLKTYTAEIETLPNEKNTENNQQPFVIEVVDESTQILLLSAFPHPDVGAIKKSILQNKQRQVDLKTPTDAIDYSNYQLVILYQPGADFKEVYKKIEAFNLPTFTITGPKTDYSFLNKIQDDFQKEISTQTENYLPIYNNSFSSFQFDNIGFDDFPPLSDNFGEVTFKKAHQDLLYQKVNSIETQNAFLSVVEDNNVRRAYLFGENIWQWRAKNFRDNDSFETFDAFTGKLFQFLASNTKRSRLQLAYENFYNSGEPILLQADYFDKNYVFDPRATLQIELKNKNTSQETNVPFILQNKTYLVDLSNLQPGEYNFTVSIKNKPISKKGSFSIVDFDVEKQFFSANTQGFRKIADSLYYPNSVDNLINNLTNNKKYQAVQKEEIKKASLIDWYYLLAIIIACLSAEWFIRKYNGLI
ncbi:vWA domain-containing protein [Haloflavibacter putidus]|uniref:VWA domain-containing protein n=1 Tax=Haloflavibacter putidus TaxID=2576776 RepID=A0A507ZP42_9FLAO|nr:vWA domain-containing protein [Haloflavibacter putidus]TQD39059.1 VWA domain-containing protein [Haloflavibacter putidus]